MEENVKKSKQLWIKVLLFVLIVVNVGVAYLLLQKLERKKSLEAQFATMKEFQPEEAEILLTFPEKIYAIAGVPMEIYNGQVTALGEKIASYNVLWNCEVGENLERKFSVNPTEEMKGSYPLTLEIYDNSLQLIASQECTLVIVDGNPQKREEAEKITSVEELSGRCLEQVRVCVDTEYNGSFDNLKPEGVAQMQDVVWAVLSGE